MRGICGWEAGKKIPCEATFSNAFLEFSHSKTAEKVHSGIVKEDLKDELIFHTSRDSTAIVSREKVAFVKEVKDESVEIKRGRGRPKKR